MEQETILSKDKDKRKTITKVDRTYRMCPDTVLNLKDDDVLTIWNPNVHLVCGFTNDDKSCIINGGDHQIEIYSAEVYNPDFKEYKLKNIVIERINFTGSAFYNIAIEGIEGDYEDTKMKAEVTVRDCHFSVSFIMCLAKYSVFCM